MKIEIDQSAGFCFGVKNAIEKAENELLQGNQVYCLGEMVHNMEEMNRLNKLGLITINHDEFEKLSNVSVLIRAHGEPPQTYEYANKAHIHLIEATCPVVIRLQKKIRDTNTENNEAQIVIAGKPDHPEVKGLAGNVNKEVVVVNDPSELDKIDFQKPVNLFVQTTLHPEKLKEIKSNMIRRFRESGYDPSNLVVKNRICGQVANRIPSLKTFCRKHDLIIFVSGKNSSNGKSLFAVCQSINPNSHFLSNEAELQAGWFKHINSVGISGATSTPGWLLEQIAQKIKELI